jgi:hypothetical protein
MQRFEFVVKNEKIKSYHRIATSLIIINIAVFILWAIRANSSKNTVIAVAGAALLSFFLLLHLYFNPQRKSSFQIASLCMAIIVWLLFYKWIAVIICMALLWLYILSVRPLAISIGADRVHYVSFPYTTLKWQELSNVILKDDILTIDHKNNKILQAELDTTHSHASEEEFNDFCRQQLKEKNGLIK